MKLIDKKFQTVSYTLAYLTDVLAKTSISFELLSEAPLWLRLLSRGQYCAYNKTIYVPTTHLELVASEHDTDKTVATGKTLPWVMLIHDNQRISFIKLLQMLYSISYQTHYTLYEILFLKATHNKFYELISLGFMTSRKSIFSFKAMPYTKIQDHLATILTNNKSVS